MTGQTSGEARDYPLGVRYEPRSARAVDQLRHLGATEDEIRSALPGIQAAFTASRSAGNLADVLSWMFILALIVLLPPHRYLPVYIIMMGVAGMVVILVGVRATLTGIHKDVTSYFLILTSLVVVYSVLVAVFRKHLGLPDSIWGWVLIASYSIIVIVIFGAAIRAEFVIKTHVLSYFEPGHALVVELCEALNLLGDKASWGNEAHRLKIARRLATAANAIDQFMLRDFASIARPKDAAILRKKLATTAAPVREKLVWLATPGPLTRTDLEKELRNAILIAATGQLDRLGRADVEEDIRQVVDHRSWWMRLGGLSREIAWAVTPLALIKLGGYLELPLLQDPANQESAQKAAYVWLALAALRSLSPGNFKETVDTVASLLDRTRAKG